MPIRFIMQRLQQMRDPSVDQAVAAALSTVGPAEMSQWGKFLLSRGEATATASLIERFDRLTPDLQAQIVARIDDLHGACREAARRRGNAGPRHVIDLVRQTRTYKLVYLVAEQLRSGPVELRRAAADCLLELTESVTRLDPAMEEATAARSEMQAAVEEALLLYRHHHQPGVLLAFAMLLPGPCGKAMSALRDSRQPAVEGLRQLILDAHEPAIVRHMLRWLTVVTLQPVVASVLPRLVRNGKLGLILQQGDLLLAGPTRQAVAKLAAPASLLPSDDEIATMSPEAGLWLPQWVQALALDDSSRIGQLMRLRRSPHEAVRLASLRMLLQMRITDQADGAAVAEELHEAIACFVEDENESIASAALHHLLTIRWAGLNRLLAKVTQESPHASLKAMAAERLGPVGFDGLWRAWHRLGRTQRIAAAKGLIKLDAGFFDLLGQRLSSADDKIRSRAIDMIATLNQGALYEEPLIALARGNDERLAASAVRALASATSQAAVDVLEASLAHRSTRVRANAVEALDLQRLGRAVERLRQMATQEENRPRANALARLLRAGDQQAPGLLRSMLADLQPAHRISALWAVEHEARLDVVSDVAEMVLADADAKVRDRAARTLKGLLATMQAA